MAEEQRPFHNPFAALEHLRGNAPVEPTALPTAATAPPASTPAASPPTGRPSVARAVVRLERVGRGGKEVTVVEHLGLPAAELAVWLKALKASLGCGGAVEEDAIVLQGDQRQRLPALLSARGVKRVTVA